MPDPNPQPAPAPRTVNKTDYRWCPECAAMVHASHLKKSEDFFSDAEPAQLCPKGHKTEAA